MDSTPGPWKTGTKYPCRVLAKKPVIVAWTCHPLNEGTETEQEKADARLIATAPELLEACEKAWDYIVNELQLTNTGIASELERVMLKAREGK